MLYVDSDNNIKLTRGDTASFDLTITENTTSYDFSNDTVVFTVKKNVYTDTILIQKTFSDGIINLTPSDTNPLNYGTYYYDVQLTTPGGSVFTVIPPTKFTVAEEVTFNGST